MKAITSTELKNAIAGVINLANSFQGGPWSLMQALRGDNDTAYLIFELETFTGPPRYLHINMAMSDELGSAEIPTEPKPSMPRPGDRTPYL